MAVYVVPVYAVGAELFPPRVRSTGLSIIYSIGVTISCSLAPMVGTDPVSLTGDRNAVAWWLILAVVVGLAALSRLEKQTQEKID